MLSDPANKFSFNLLSSEEMPKIPIFLRALMPINIYHPSIISN